MAANLQEATRESASGLVGDLHSIPDPSRRLYDQDIYGLDWALPYSGSERPLLESIIRERRAMLEAELADPRCRFLSALVQSRVSHQLRARPDYQSDRIAVEQWIPALEFWLVNGYFDWATDADEIVITLLAGDPRQETAIDALNRRREESATRRGVIDQQNSDKVLAAVDNLSRKALDQFIEVEEAIQTGDTITAHGADLDSLTAMHDRTLHAAAHGDAHAQSVLTCGQRDDSTCALPSTNPLTHRHGSLNRPTR